MEEDVTASDIAHELLGEIVTSGRYMHEISDDALMALHKGNREGADGPVIFMFGDTLCRRIDGRDGVRLEPLNKAAMKGMMDRSANYVKVVTVRGSDEIRHVPSRVPTDVVEDILSMPRQDHDFPVLDGIVGAPVLLPEGRFLLKQGYDEGSRLYLNLNGLGKMVTPRMSVTKAKDLILNELLGEFPFVDDASKAHTLCAMLQPFVRPCIFGPTPMLLLDSPTRGTGKGLTADCISIVVLGRVAYVTPLSTSEDEIRKTITSLLIDGRSLICWDDVVKLDSHSLNTLLTGERWSDRIMGLSKMADVPNRALWIATGNNIELSDEQARRTVLSRQDAGVEIPEDRRDFRHPELAVWALENRPKLVSACLSLVNAWVKKGMPDGKQTLGRFESWTKVLGGILDVIEVVGFLENRGSVYTTASERDEWLTLCEEWWRVHEAIHVTAKDILAILSSRGGLLLDLWGAKKELAACQSIGRAVLRRRDQVFGDYTIRRADTPDASTGSTAYYLDKK